MKRMLFIVMCFLPLALTAQKDDLDDFFSRYSGDEDYTFVTINGNLFGLIKSLDEDSDLADLERKITSIRIVAGENGHRLSNDLMEDLKGIIRHGKYEELMSVNSDGDNVLCLARTSGETLKEILIIAEGEDQAVIQIKGTLREDDLDMLSSSHIDGLEYLEMLENERK